MFDIKSGIYTLYIKIKTIHLATCSMSYTIPVIIVLVFDIHIYRYSYKTLLFKIIRVEWKGVTEIQVSNGDAQFYFWLFQLFLQKPTGFFCYSKYQIIKTKTTTQQNKKRQFGWWKNELHLDSTGHGSVRSETRFCVVLHAASDSTGSVSEVDCLDLLTV